MSDRGIHEQITKYLTDIHSIEEPALVQMRGAPDIAEDEEVAAAFPEFARYATSCRFDNCRHLEEPECGVVRAAESGALAATRLASYRQLLAEAKAASRPWVIGLHERYMIFSGSSSRIFFTTF